MRLLVWLLRAFLFFALFAFALNNQQGVTVNLFFGVQWQVRLVILVLVAFAGGCVVGVLAMLPNWWRARRAAARLAPAPVPAPPTVQHSVPPSELITEHPPRVGL